MPITTSGSEVQAMDRGTVTAREVLQESAGYLGQLRYGGVGLMCSIVVGLSARNMEENLR